MQYLALQKVSKSYGEKILFDEINLVVSRGNKIALIARNGSGKSTLLRVISGEEAAEGEQAKIVQNSNIRVAFLAQNPTFSSTKSIIEVCYEIEEKQIQAYRNYDLALLSGESQIIESTMAVVEELKAWKTPSKIKEILFKLGLTNLDQPIATLSGGEQKRLSLAKVILCEPDFLILDEPTNHLDLEMIEWLEKYLQNQKLTVLMVTHDRYFLERVCNQIIELDDGRLQQYFGNYSNYLSKKSAQELVEQKTHEKAKKLLGRELNWMNRQPKARGTKAKSRIDNYFDLKEKVNAVKAGSSLEIEVDSRRLGKKILECHDVGLTYADRTIIDKFSYKFKKGEKVGVVGQNGTGKSSFANILAGQSNNFTGKVHRGETLKIGYYEQRNTDLNTKKKVIDVIRDIAEYIPLSKGHKLSASKLLENFMFTPEQQQVRVSQLSGGELKRLQLICVLTSNPNFLILDEPTNDLDLLTLRALENYLMSFKGCLVLITHDRFLLDRLVDHLFIFSGEGRIEDYNGTYSEWKKLTKEKIPVQPIIQKGEKSSNQKDLNKLKSRYKKEMRVIEQEIQALEIRKEELIKTFEDTALAPEKITQVSIELSALNIEIDNKEMRWIELAELL